MNDFERLTAGLGGQPNATILVLGATSLIGRFLSPRLVEAGCAVTAVSRSPPHPPWDLTWVCADLTDPTLGRRLPPVNAIVSLSPIWLLPPVIPALAGTGAKRLIAFSSTSRLTKIASSIPQERAVAERCGGKVHFLHED